VVLQVTLKIEVVELVRLGVLVVVEELDELGIGVDDAAIVLVLKTVCANVFGDLLAGLSAGHLSSNLLSEELGKLVTDAGGHHEPSGLTLAVRLALLAGSLGCVLHLAGDGLLKGLEVGLHVGEEGGKLLKLGGELSHLKGSRWLLNGLGDGDLVDGLGLGRSLLGRLLGGRLGSLLGGLGGSCFFG